MVENHGTIAAVNVRQRFFNRIRLREYRPLLQDCCNIGIALPDMMLSSSEVTVDETDGSIINDESRNDATLHPSN